MRPLWVFIGILGLALALRLGLALSYPGMWGVDGGASLLTVNAVLGDEPTGAGFPKPPLAPGWLLAPFVLLLGADDGYKTWSAVFAILPIIPVFLLTRQYLGDWPGVFASLFAAIDLTWGEMFVTGAHPLVAFALLGMAWWSMGELYRHWTLKNALILTLCVGLIPWVNQTAAGLALIMLPTYYLALLGLEWRRYHREKLANNGLAHGGPLCNLLQIIPFALLGGFIALGALPWYLQTLPGSSILSYDGPILYLAHWSDSAWIQAALIAWPLGVFCVWKSSDVRVKAMGVGLITLGLMVPWLSYDEVIINPPYRARYLMALTVYPLITWVVWRYWLPSTGKRVAVATGALAVAVMAYGFVYIVNLQSEYSQMVTPETAKALTWLQEHDNGNGVATNSFTLSLWVAGLNKVKSPFAFTAPPPPAYVQDDADLRCVLNWVDGCEPHQSATRLGIKYLLIEQRFPFYNDRVPGNYLAPPDQWGRTAEAAWLELVYSEQTTRLYRITSDAS